MRSIELAFIGVREDAAQFIRWQVALYQVLLIATTFKAFLVRSGDGSALRLPGPRRCSPWHHGRLHFQVSRPFAHVALDGQTLRIKLPFCRELRHLALAFDIGRLSEGFIPFY